MTTVKQLLDFKGHDIVSIEPDRTVYEAIERLAERRIGALLVIENTSSSVCSVNATTRARWF